MHDLLSPAKVSKHTSYCMQANATPAILN